MHYIGKSPYRQHDTALHSATQCCAMLPIWGPYIRVLLMNLSLPSLNWELLVMRVPGVVWYPN